MAGANLSGDQIIFNCTYDAENKSPKSRHLKRKNYIRAYFGMTNRAPALCFGKNFWVCITRFSFGIKKSTLRWRERNTVTRSSQLENEDRVLATVQSDCVLHIAAIVHHLFTFTSFEYLNFCTSRSVFHGNWKVWTKLNPSTSGSGWS